MSETTQVTDWASMPHASRMTEESRLRRASEPCPGPSFQETNPRQLHMWRYIPALASKPGRHCCALCGALKDSF